MRTFIFAIASAALVFTGAGTAAHAAGCSKTAIAQAADDTAAARQILLDLPVGDGLEPHVSPGAKRAIIRFKASLEKLVSMYMDCSAPGTPPATIIADLDKLARRDTPPKSDASHYGYAIDVGASAPANNPGVMLIDISFSIECQDDSLLFAYTTERGAWHEALLWQSKPYDFVGAAHGSLRYEISPPDDAGHWYLLANSTSFGCVSFWSGFGYTVLRPRMGSLDPRIIYDDGELIYWGNEDYGELTAAKDWFDVQFHSFSIDVGVHNRLWIRHFSIRGDKVTRIQPVAESPSDFVDEWIVSSWREASDWTAPAMRASLRPLHGHLAHYRDGIGSFQYESIRSCGDRDDWTQIEVSSEEKGDPSYFFGVAGKQPFQLISASRKPDPLCQGKDQHQH